MRFLCLPLLLAVSLWSAPAWSDGKADWKAAVKAYNDGDMPAALDLFSRAIDSGEFKSWRLARLYRSRGIVYGLSDYRKSAILDFSEAIRIRPDYAEAYGARCLEYLNDRRSDQALADCNASLRLVAKQADILSLRARIYEKKGLYDRAIADYESAIATDPKSWKSFLNYGNLHHRRGDKEKAKPLYKRAIDLAPEWAFEFNPMRSVFEEYGLM